MTARRYPRPRGATRVPGGKDWQRLEPARMPATTGISPREQEDAILLLAYFAAPPPVRTI